MTTKQKAYIGLGLTSIIWGTTWVASKYGIKQGMLAFELSAIRNGLGGLSLIVFFLIKGQKMPTFKEFKWLLGMSILLFVIANGFSTYALNEIPSGLAARRPADRHQRPVGRPGQKHDAPHRPDGTG